MVQERIKMGTSLRVREGIEERDPSRGSLLGSLEGWGSCALSGVSSAEISAIPKAVPACLCPRFLNPKEFL